MQMFAQGTSQATESEMEPMWTHITEFTNSFDISSGGLAQYDTSLYARGNIIKSSLMPASSNTMEAGKRSKAGRALPTATAVI